MPELGEDANGSELELNLGEELTIRLPENRTAGFQWQLAAAENSICRLIDETFAAGSPGPGSTGMHSWRFQAAQAGQCSIELAYRRPWEEDAGRQFSVLVRVSGG